MLPLTALRQLDRSRIIANMRPAVQYPGTPAPCGRSFSRSRLLAGLLFTALLASGAVRASSGIELDGATSFCRANMSRVARVAVLNDLTRQLEGQLKKFPGLLRDQAARAQLGTFIAGSMSDEIPFISLDRWCWADFYQARQLLSARDEAGAYEAASDWQVCLTATFPDRIELARPYFSCFPGNRKRGLEQKRAD